MPYCDLTKAAMKLPENCRKEFKEAFNTTGCMDLYDGNLEQSLPSFKERKMKANLGDKVKIIEPGLLYSNYDTAAKIMGLIKWKGYANDLDKDKVYLVLNDFEHNKSGKRLLGITDGKKDYIIGEEGVIVVNLDYDWEIKETSITTKPEKPIEVQFFDINNLSL